MNQTLVCLGTVVFLGIGFQPGWAHGGQYGIGPKPPSDYGPSDPPAFPSGPSTPAPSSLPGSGPGAFFVEGASQNPLDPAQWTYWWELHRDYYLDLKKRSAGRALSEGHSPLLNGAIATALEVPVLEAKEGDLALACLIALARAGEPRRLLGLLQQCMASGNQALSERAVLAHGIAGLEPSRPDLLELFLDTPTGRELVGDWPRVGFRKRAFAGYALGMIASRSRSNAVKRSVFEAARLVLSSTDRPAHFEVLVAAVQAMRLLAPNPEHPEGAALTLEAAGFLLGLLRARENHDILRAHAAVALSRLLGRVSSSPALAALGGEAIEIFKYGLRDRSERFLVGHSFTLALGQMAHPGDPSVLGLLVEALSGKLCGNLQARNFACMALGHLGGGEAKARLLAGLGSPSLKQERPWIALALGVLVAEDEARGGPPDPKVGLGLLMAFLRTEPSLDKAGIALALGLASSQDTAGLLHGELRRCEDPVQLGHYAVALGLLGFQDAVADLGRLLQRSRRAPSLFREVALGLGLMGDPLLQVHLIQALSAASVTTLERACLASALGLVGDHRALAPLVEVFFNTSDNCRPFAAEALGRICARPGLPTRAALAFGLNYRAGVETLTGTSGILAQFD